MGAPGLQPCLQLLANHWRRRALTPYFPEIPNFFTYSLGGPDGQSKKCKSITEHEQPAGASIVGGRRVFVTPRSCSEYELHSEEGGDYHSCQDTLYHRWKTVRAQRPNGARDKLYRASWQGRCFSVLLRSRGQVQRSRDRRERYRLQCADRRRSHPDACGFRAGRDRAVSQPRISEQCRLAAQCYLANRRLRPQSASE